MADEYINIDKQTLDLIKYPPLYSPIVVYGSDYNYSSNNLRGKLWQFCYRYKYVDTKMKSVFCPYSEVAIPQGEELPNGDFLPDFHHNNFIAVGLNFGHHTVEEIEVAYRIGNLGNLYVYDRIKRYVLPVEAKFTGRIVKGNQSAIDMVGRDGGINIKDIKEGMVLNGPSFDIDNFFIVKVDIPNETVYLSGVASVRHGLPSWYITTEVDIVAEYSIFRNDKVDYAVPTQEAIESFDGAPLTCGSFEVIESNRIVVGNVKTGFDNTVPDVEASVLNEEKSAYLSKFAFPNEYLILDFADVEPIGIHTTMNFVVIKFPNSYVDKDYISLSFHFIDTTNSQPVNLNVSYFYSASLGDTPEVIVEYIKNALDAYNPEPLVNFSIRTLDEFNSIWPIPQFSILFKYKRGEYVIRSNKVYIAIQNSSHLTPSGTSLNNAYWGYLCEYSEMDRALILTTTNIPAGTFNHYQLLSYGAEIYKSQEVYSIFKYGCPINVGIEYFDYAGRLSAANKSEQMTIDIPYMSSIVSTPDAFSYNNIVNNVKLEIKHKPPIDAYGYRILIDRNVPWFFQFFFYGPANDDTDITDDNIHWRINVNRTIQNLRDYIPKATLSPYLFEKGDRIRILAFQNSLDVNYTLNRWRKYNQVYDAEIIGYDYPLESETYMKDNGDGTPGTGDYILDSDGNKIREVSTGYIIVERSPIPTADIASAVYLLYEIYRPRKVSDENTAYWEIGKSFAIGNPGAEERYHKGDTDQDPADLINTPAEVTLNGGNVYRKMRYSGEADVYFPVESLSLSDFYESDSISIGRSNIISEDIEQITEENAYMWSLTFLEDTAINQLNKFPTGNKGRLQSKHGTITAFLEQGFILTAFQDRKITSIYIGRQSLIDPSDGSERINLLSNAVFGTVRPSASEYGCSDPKSISVSQTHIYFWDGYNSEWCRLAYNGIFPISDYGENKFFSNLNAAMKLDGTRRSISAFDFKHDELIVSHEYQTVNDYYLTIIGQYVIGENKLTGIGRSGGSVIADLQVGMILTQLASSEVTPEINLTILKIDSASRTIYLEQMIPFGVGITGPVEITALVLKRVEMVTLAFNEPTNGWKSRYPFVPEFMINYGDELLSFINGRCYLHNSDYVPSNNFYGIQFEQWIKFAFVFPITMIFEGIEFISNKRWGAIAKGDIQVIAMDDRGMDMESKLPSVKFRNVEGKFVSELLRDMNTPGIDNENHALMEGRFLRGPVCIVKFTNFETVKTVLYEVSIYFNQSL